jgi:hypothetical protein
MVSHKIYEGERDIFTTHLFDVNKTALGEQLVSQLKSKRGHIVIRVNSGGNSYNVYILDDSAENFKVTDIHGPYISN